ncbi:MAG: hypothetical protein J5608_01255 [Alphaproteobacteria bacterium]|nr:hypothetical protein [Alphaproteobacteria bacterium]
MKNYAKVLVFAAIVALIVVPAQAAGSGIAVGGDMCGLIGKLQGVFKTLRLLAFVGAGFYMAQWAWKYISSGDVKMDDLKNQGTGLLVGFTLLFAIGVIITFLLSAAKDANTGINCVDQLKTGW